MAQHQSIDDENEQMMRLLSSVEYCDDTVGNYHESIYSSDDTTNFIYNDNDTIDKEIAEIYSYNENIEHVDNYKAFEDFLDIYQYTSNWKHLKYNEKIDIIQKLNEQLEINDNNKRMELYRCILYIVQGCWNYIDVIDELIQEQKHNATLLYRFGVFENLIKLLYLEKNCSKTPIKRKKNLKTTQRLRVILSILSTIIEIVRNDQQLSQHLKYDLLNPENNELLIITLFNMIVDFIKNRRQFCHYPIKKILILLSKLISITLGDLKQAKQFKCEQRAKFNLNNDHDRCVANQQQQQQQQKRKLRPKLNEQNYLKILNKIRLKYIGFTIGNDTTTLTGLPDCVIESISILQKHLYTPLSVKHEEQEKFIDKHYNKQRDDYDLNPIELLYQTLLPNLSLYIGALTAIFFKLSTTNVNDNNLKAFTAEILPTEMQHTEMELLILTIDICRHKEIIFKAISSILLLFLKHFKNNHYYQYECLCAILVKEKFFNVNVRFLHQNLQDYIDTPNELNMIEFPFYIIKRFENSNSITIESHYQWRQLYVCINFLRILNKIVKHKPQHIEFIIRRRIYDDLKQNLQIHNRMLQYYSMKLMKLQIPYLKKPWINANLNTINAIYHHVRYHLLDDFLKRSTICLGLQQHFKENQLQIAIENFHKRRYNYVNNTNIIDKADNNVYMDYEDDYQPVDNCLQSVLGQHVQLCPIFKRHYETWLEYEVYQTKS